MGQMAKTQGTPGANPALSGAQNQQQGLASLMQMIQANRAAQQGIPSGPVTGGVFPVPPTGGAFQGPLTGGVYPVPPTGSALQGHPTGGLYPVPPAGLGPLGNGIQSPIGGLTGLQNPQPGVPVFTPEQQGGLNALRAQRQARRFNRRGGVAPIGL